MLMGLKRDKNWTDKTLIPRDERSHKGAKGAMRCKGFILAQMAHAAYERI